MVQHLNARQMDTILFSYIQFWFCNGRSSTYDIAQGHLNTETFWNVSFIKFGIQKVFWSLSWVATFRFWAVSFRIRITGPVWSLNTVLVQYFYGESLSGWGSKYRTSPVSEKEILIFAWDNIPRLGATYKNGNIVVLYISPIGWEWEKLFD